MEEATVLDQLPRKRWTPRIPVRGHVSLVVGTAIVLTFILIALFAPLITQFDPNTQDLEATLLPPGVSGHWFGTDQFGRDVFSRVVYATRIDLLIAFGATLVAACIGSLAGLIAGLSGRKTESVIMRIVDVVFAFPFVVLVLVIIAILGTGLLNMFIAMWAVTWAPYTRIVHAQVQVVRSHEYIVGARALGYGRVRIMLRHVLPNVIGVSVVFATVDAVNNVSLGAALGYLGLGVQPPTAEWGNMIADSQQFIATNWWLPVAPGVAIALFGLGVSMVGEGLTNRLRGER